jgi:hypothetical protein
MKIHTREETDRKDDFGRFRHRLSGGLRYKTAFVQPENDFTVTLSPRVDKRYA